MPLIALCLGFFMVIIDVTIVNVALPNMEKALSGDVSWLQWVVAGYTLTFACLLLSAGNLSDRFGAKNIYIIGLILFVLTSLACGLSTNFESLTAFRLLQGIAAALLVPTSLALINSSYENKIDRAQAIGIWAALAGIAAASGPVLGAILTAWFGWQAVFFVNVPIGIIALIITIKYVRNYFYNEASYFDFQGQLLGIISIASLAFSLIEAGKFGWFATNVVIAFFIFLITFIAFLLIENRAHAPMFPLQLFKSQTFSASIAVGMIINLGTYGTLFLLPLYFQQIKGYSVLMTGLAIAPLTALMAISCYFSGKLTSVIGPKVPMVAGLLVGAVGFLIMLIAREHTPYILLVLPLVLIGAGASFTMPAATIAIINSAPENQAGIVSGAFNTSRQIGSLVGVAIFGTIVNTSTHFISGMQYTLFIGSITFIIGAIAAFVSVSK